MDHTFCPGSKLLRQPAPEIFACPSCGQEVEIWTDELRGNCPGCGQTMYRDAAMSCLDWCKYGEECVGEAAYSNYMKNRAVGLKSRLLDAVRAHFGTDRGRAAHAEAVLRMAEKILEEERGDWHLVIPASILHDVGIKAAAEKRGPISDAGHNEAEGTAAAREILRRLGFKIEDISQVCEIIAGRHTPGEADSQNFKIVHDADLLANLGDAVRNECEEALQELNARGFLTDAGGRLAREVLPSSDLETLDRGTAVDVGERASRARA
jgi:HD superfamily phosphodiesterase/predicted RNA-binding Zn-ribbon protein involved in translation (DUF1610 family)